MAIAVTYLEQFSPLPKNSVTVFDRFGKEVLTYSKVHTCDFWVEKNLTPGDDFYTAALRRGNPFDSKCLSAGAEPTDAAAYPRV